MNKHFHKRFHTERSEQRNEGRGIPECEKEVESYRTMCCINQCMFGQNYR